MVLNNTLRDELMPFASVDAIIERRHRRQQKGGVLGKVEQHVADRIDQAKGTEQAEGNDETEAEAPEGGDEQ